MVIQKNSDKDIISGSSMAFKGWEISSLEFGFE
jgi:hypothetical protein